MRARLLSILLLGVLGTLVATGSAVAASVAYVDANNVWLSSPDGAAKFQLTTDGAPDSDAWRTPSQGPDGRTVAVHQDTFDGGSKRPVLYLFGADGKRVTANVMPVYSGAMIPVYPIGLDLAWDGQAVAYGYSYCTFACNSTVKGFWLTFSDNQGLYPSDPQGQTDAYFPTFYGKRVVSSDSGGRIFVQPDVPEAPFTTSSSGWLSMSGVYLSRAEVSSAPANLVAIEWSRSSDGAEGIVVGRHQGTVPSDVTDLCDLPVSGSSDNVTFSPDGTLIAWHDADGVKVAGAPNLVPGGSAQCALSAPPVVISATGGQPSFGGADVPAIRRANGLDAPPAGPGGPGYPGGGTGTGTGTESGGGGGGTTTPVGAGKVTLTLPAKATRAAFRKGLRLRVKVPRAGRIDASATVGASVARRLRLGSAGRGSKALAGAASARGFAAASRSVVVARGRTKAKRAGAVTLVLKPTAKARRAARRMGNVTLTIRVAQGGAKADRKLRLRR